MSDTAALVDAIHSNDASRVSAVLEQHRDLIPKLNQPLPELAFGSTALFAAVHRRNREMVDVLLKAGADINTRTDWWAGSFGVLDLTDREMVEYLIARGAKLDIHSAARHGMIDEVRELLAEDPSRVRARGGDGQTPLHVAATLEIARLLIERGADIDARDVDHESTPAQYQIGDHPEIARELVERGAEFDLLLVTALGDVARVRQVLDREPEAIRMSVHEHLFPKKNPRSGGSIYQWTLGAHKTAHQIARERGHSEVLALLNERSPAEVRFAEAVAAGDEPEIQALRAAHPDLIGNLTPAELRRLPDAARNDDWSAVRRFVQAGWPLDSRGQHGGMALHWAAWHGNLQIVRELVAKGAPLEVKDHDFDATPLGWAAWSSVHGWHPDRGDYAGVVTALLDAGAEAPEVSEKLDASTAVRQALGKRS